MGMDAFLHIVANCTTSVYIGICVDFFSIIASEQLSHAWHWGESLMRNQQNIIQLVFLVTDSWHKPWPLCHVRHPCKQKAVDVFDLGMN